MDDAVGLIEAVCCRFDADDCAMSYAGLGDPDFGRWTPGI